MFGGTLKTLHLECNSFIDKAVEVIKQVNHEKPLFDKTGPKGETLKENNTFFKERRGCPKKRNYS